MGILKVLPWKCVTRFRKRGNLGPRYCGPFQILAQVARVSYRLDLPEELSQIHNTFHVSHLLRCLVDDFVVVSLEEI